MSSDSTKGLRDADLNATKAAYYLADAYAAKAEFYCATDIGEQERLTVRYIRSMQLAHIYSNLATGESAGE